MTAGPDPDAWEPGPVRGPWPDDPDPRPRRLTRQQVRDLLSMILVVAGVAGLVLVSFAVDARLGMAAVCVAICGGGLLLGWDRSQ